MSLRKMLHALPPDGLVIHRTRKSFKDFAADAYGQVSTKFSSSSEPFYASSRLLTVNNVSFTTSLVSDAHVTRFAEFPFYAQGFLISGGAEVRAGRHTGCLSTHFSAAVNEGEQFTLARAANTEMLTMRIEPTALMSKLGALLGESAPHKATFSADVGVAKADMRPMIRTIEFLIEVQLSLRGGAREIICSEFEQSLMVLYLFTNRHEFRGSLERREHDVAAWQVSLAEEYIEAHLNEPITIEMLVAITGSSARSLFQTFRSCRGYSPMQFVQSRRLHRARETLQDPGKDYSVAGVASACGFANLAHFARAYFEAFGEPPSETLLVARRLARLH